MAVTVELRYGITFGKCDSSDWIEWYIDLEDEAEEAYLTAKKLRLPFDSFPILCDALSEATDDIEEEEIEIGIEMGDETVLEAIGQYPVDGDEINDLVAERDEYTLEFFGLEDLTDEELDEWDANELEELPDICDFKEDFEPSSPFECGLDLYVEYAERPEEEPLEKTEATETLQELFRDAQGDYTVIAEYIDRCEDLYEDGDLCALALQIAEEMGIQDFAIE